MGKLLYQGYYEFFCYIFLKLIFGLRGIGKYYYFMFIYIYRFNRVIY